MKAGKGLWVGAALAAIGCVNRGQGRSYTCLMHIDRPLA